MSDTKTKKLLMIFDTPFPFILGGGQRRVFEIGKRLTKYGKVDWLCFKAWTGAASIESDNITYIGTRDIPDMYGKNGNRNAKEPLKFLFDILKRLNLFKHYDTVWVAQWPLIHLIPIIITCKLFRIGLIIDWWEVWSLRNWYSYHRILGPIGFFVQQVTLLFVKIFKITVVTDNNVEFKKLDATLGRNYPLFNIPNGIPKEQIEEGRIDLSNGYDIISLGRLKNHKGVDILIKATSIMVKRGMSNIRVGIIGDGPERENLRSLINELKLQNNVFLLGSIEKFETVYGILKSSKLCALTTHNGGGGNLTLLEAYGCNLPVIAFKLNEGIDENLILNGKSGLFITEVSAAALADGIQSILKDKILLTNLKIGASNFAKSLTWDASANKYREIMLDKGFKID